MRREFMPTTFDGQLVHLQEEASEIIKTICKVKRFGLDHQLEGKRLSNAEKLCAEIRDMERAIEIVREKLPVGRMFDARGNEYHVGDQVRVIGVEAMTPVTVKRLTHEGVFVGYHGIEAIQLMHPELDIEIMPVDSGAKLDERLTKPLSVHGWGGIVAWWWEYPSKHNLIAIDVGLLAKHSLQMGVTLSHPQAMAFRRELVSVLEGADRPAPDLTEKNASAWVRRAGEIAVDIRIPGNDADDHDSLGVTISRARAQQLVADLHDLINAQTRA